MDNVTQTSSENDSGDLVTSSSVQSIHEEEEQHIQSKAQSRRKKCFFTKMEREILERAFLNCSNPTEEVRKKIAAEINSPEARVRCWFTNRQTKKKNTDFQLENSKLRNENSMLREQFSRWFSKLQNENSMLHAELSRCSTIMSQCHYCNSQIHQRANMQQANANGRSSSVNDALVYCVPRAYLSAQPMQVSRPGDMYKENDLNLCQCPEGALSISNAAFKEIPMMATKSNSSFNGIPELGSPEEKLQMFHGPPPSGMRVECSVESIIGPMTPSDNCSHDSVRSNFCNGERVHLPTNDSTLTQQWNEQVLWQEGFPPPPSPSPFFFPSFSLRPNA